MEKDRSARFLEQRLLPSHAMTRTWHSMHPELEKTGCLWQENQREVALPQGFQTFTHLFPLIQWLASSTNYSYIKLLAAVSRVTFKTFSPGQRTNMTKDSVAKEKTMHVSLLSLPFFFFLIYMVYFVLLLLSKYSCVFLSQKQGSFFRKQKKLK